MVFNDRKLGYHAFCRLPVYCSDYHLLCRGCLSVSGYCCFTTGGCQNGIECITADFCQSDSTILIESDVAVHTENTHHPSRESPVSLEQDATDTTVGRVRRANNVLSIKNRLKILCWMVEEVERGGSEEGLSSKTIRQFPQFFRSW